MQVGTNKDQGLYSKPSAAVHPGALAAGTLIHNITYHVVWGCGTDYIEDLHGSRFALTINTRPRHVIRVYFGGCIKTVRRGVVLPGE